jgi:hypothetical protein
VSQFLPTSPEPVLVTNTTGRAATITGITLDPGPYTINFAQTTCSVGEVLAAGGTCTITLEAIAG